MGIRERREKEKRELRGLILDTAKRLFIEEGFDKVTMRRIAAEIEYSPATIYLHFKDKDDILAALHEEAFEKFYARQRTILSEKDPWQRLHNHARVYLSFALENPEFYDLMFIMRGPFRKLKERKEWATGMRSFEFLKENIKDCMSAGYLPKADLDVAAFAVWSFTHGMASLIIRDRMVKFPEEMIPTITEGALEFMMKGFGKKK